MQITLDHTLPIPIPYPTDLSMQANYLGNQCRMSHGTLLHNHPSGDPKPSRDDIEMTREIRKAAEALGIAIHDHLVIGRKGHASFRSLGLLS
jgi:DNA repair protein RadC